MTAQGFNAEAGCVLDGRYLIERIIGEGGMGTVFAARHLELGELVALKILHSSVAIEEEHLERFLREARLAARLKNEHVVRIIDVARGRDATPPYIVMEFLDGIDLGDVLQTHGPIPAREAVDYVLQACEAVVEAHRLGIVHRDLKPSNLLLTERADGTPLLKILDFGISKAHDEEDSKLTKTQAVFGSPAYMSPEQIRSAKHVDQRSDVWAIAVVLYELLTGRLPFEGKTATAILAAVSADPPLPLRQFAPHVPEGLEQAIEACLVKDRDRRVAGIGDLAILLAPFASPAGLVSVEAVKRSSLIPRPSVPSAPPRASGSLLPFAADMTPPRPFRPLRDTRPSGPPEALGRTDRAIVVPSRRNLASNAPIIGLAALLAVAIVLLLTLLLRRWSAERDLTTAAPAPVPSVEATALPSADPPVPAVVAPAPPPTSAAPPRPSLSSPARPPLLTRPHPGHPAASPPPPSAPPPPPSPQRPGEVDTNSRL